MCSLSDIVACASDGINRFYHDRQSCFGAFYGESKAISPHCNVQPLPIKGFCSPALRPAPGEASPAPAGRAGSPVTVCTCGRAPPRPAR